MGFGTYPSIPARPKHRSRSPLIGMSCQGYERQMLFPCFLFLLSNQPCRLQAIHDRHLYVQQGDVEFVSLPDGIYGFPPLWTATTVCPRFSSIRTASKLVHAVILAKRECAAEVRLPRFQSHPSPHSVVLPRIYLRPSG